ncbi:cytochrome o ubiquinol oxidase subunit III [Salinicola sp. CR57]|uniref:cytochrome o ubiquinol oxidase subunit III n=1 Tax=Salinicola sp. CR57 TaxID=1949086 RepID=UPI000DA13342|nr:cytochrome o ubiquinol oxidase subunit III [Salinicola sp. CR57]
MATDTLKQHDAHAHDGHEHHDAGAMKVFGFWIYLMSDLVIFGTLFATFGVLATATAGGPTSQEIFELPFVLVETFLLLISSFTFGLAVLAQNAGDRGAVLKWLAVTFLLGFGFVAMEVYEFHHLIAQGHGPDRSAFLSAFFTLVGTHGLHVTFGLIWIAIMFFQISKQGLDSVTKPRMLCLSLFWHFLDIVWICVFSFVYLMGAM